MRFAGETATHAPRLQVLAERIQRNLPVLVTDDLQKFKGHCQCGAISFVAVMPTPKAAMLCDCSICRRKGIAMSVDLIPKDNLLVQDPEKQLTLYQFGSLTARHYFCACCGVHAYVETRLNPGFSRINLGCLDDVDMSSLTFTTFDGRAL